MYEGGDPEKSRILLRALTGVTATTNIDRISTHLYLKINVRSTLYPLSDRQQVALRNKLSED